VLLEIKLSDKLCNFAYIFLIPNKENTKE